MAGSPIATHWGVNEKTANVFCGGVGPSKVADHVMEWTCPPTAAARTEPSTSLAVVSEHVWVKAVQLTDVPHESPPLPATALPEVTAA
jgi:hypothetical protein